MLQLVLSLSRILMADWGQIGPAHQEGEHEI
jgi:hypothetical protein